jgi:hypothetical protein
MLHPELMSLQNFIASLIERILSPLTLLIFLLVRDVGKARIGPTPGDGTE